MATGGRRRRRGAGYPTGGVDVSSVGGGSGGVGNSGFDPLDVLSAASEPDNVEGGAGITITNVNTAIAQANVEQGPGNQAPGPITGVVGGGGTHHHHHHH